MPAFATSDDDPAFFHSQDGIIWILIDRLALWAKPPLIARYGDSISHPQSYRKIEVSPRPGLSTHSRLLLQQVEKYLDSFLGESPCCVSRNAPLCHFESFTSRAVLKCIRLSRSIGSQLVKSSRTIAPHQSLPFSFFGGASESRWQLLWLPQRQ